MSPKLSRMSKTDSTQNSITKKTRKQLIAKTFAILALLSLSVFSSAILIAQSVATEPVDDVSRWVSPVEGFDPTVDIKIPDPGLLDRAYTAVFGSKGGSNSNLVPVDIFSVGMVASGDLTTDNDYTRINAAIQSAVSGNAYTLHGTFDWTEINAKNSWAAGSDGNPATTGDNYRILVPKDIDNVTVTATTLGTARIQGPGDVVGVNLEGVFYFALSSSPSRTAGSNQGWTFSNLEIFDFDTSIVYFNNAASTSAGFGNTSITNNRLRIAQDNNATIDPIDLSQNIAIHFPFGSNNLISGNEIIFTGDGVSDGANFSSQVAMQSNTAGGSAYDGLQITNNVLKVNNAQFAANPQIIIGIWENGHSHTSNITVSGNTFSNLSGGNIPASNLQRAFRTTSHSSATTAVNFSNNSMEGANIGIQMLNVSGVTHPVNFTSNNISNNTTGLIMWRDLSVSNTIANLTNNRVAGNAVAIDNSVPAYLATATADNNWWGCNSGPGGATSAGCPVAANANAGAVAASTFLTLTATASPTFVVSGGNTTVTGTITNVPDGTPVTFGSANAFGTALGNGPTIGGSRAGTYTGNPADAGAGVATVTVDGQTMNAAVTVHPKVNSITRLAPLAQHTNSTTLIFRVVFSSAVANVEDTDFIATTVSGSIVGVVPTTTGGVSPFTTFDVTVTTSGGDGEIKLDLIDNNSIERRLAPAIKLGGPALNDGDFFGGESYIVDNTAPTVSAITLGGPSPTAANSVTFNVTFSEDVDPLTVDAADFALTGSYTTGTIASATGSGSSYVVTVNGITVPSPSGTLGINLVNNGTIKDTALPTPNTLSGGGSSLLYTIDQSGPTGTLAQSNGQPDPTSGSSVSFTVVFTDAATPLTGFDASDVAIATGGGTAFANPADPIVNVSGPTGSSPTTTYTVTVTGMNQAGQVTATVGAGATTGVEDSFGNLSADVVENDNTVFYTVGSAVLMVDTDGMASTTSCADPTPTAYTTIQAAVAAAGASTTIRVCPGGAGNYIMGSNAFTISQNGLTIVNAEATKPVIQVTKPTGTQSITVLASNVSINGIHFVKTDGFGEHNLIGVQGTNFTASNNDFTANTPWTPSDYVCRAFVISSSATSLNLSGNTFTDFRQPAYINGDGVTVMGNITNNVATRTKGWVVDEALLNFSGNTFGVTCPNCDADIALISFKNNIPEPATPTFVAHYSPYLTLSQNNDNAYIRVRIPVNPQPSGRAVTFANDGAPAANPDGRTVTQYRSTIQDAINNTLPDGIVNVAAGIYTEKLTVDRALDIRGAQYGVATGGRTNPVNESIIRAAVGDFDPFDGLDAENSVMVTMTAEGVKLNGFTVDGDNPSIDSNHTLNSADVDAFGGISGTGTINPNADISYNIVKNMGEFGIEIYGDYNAAGTRTLSTISNNKVDNVVGWTNGNAIFVGNDALVNVTDNVVDHSFAGVMIHHFDGQITGSPNATVSNNTITAFGYAIWFNLHFAYSGNGYTVSNNTISSYVEYDATSLANRATNSKYEGDKATGLKRPRRDLGTTNSVGGWDTFIGLKIESVNGLVPATFSGNSINVGRAALIADGYTVIDGIRTTNTSTDSSNIAITGNTVNNAKRGLAHTAPALINVTCNNFTNNEVGVYVGHDRQYQNPGDPGPSDSYATGGINLNNNNILGNSMFGVQNDQSVGLPPLPAGPTAIPTSNADQNYWGSFDGPGVIASGSGDKVTTFVNFNTPMGFLTAPTLCGPVDPPPTVTINQKVGQVDPTNVSPVEFTVVFSEAVTDFTDSDVTLTGTAVPTTAIVTGGPTTYNVAVSGMTAVGTVIATVPAGATTTGVSGPNVASTSMDNTITYDAVGPTPTIDDVVGSTSTSPVNFTVDFGEQVTGFTAADIDTSLSTTSGTLSVVVTPVGPAQTYNVAVTGMTSSGDVVIDFMAGVANDLSSNPSNAPTLTDNSVAFTLVNNNVVISSANTLDWGFLTETASGTGSFVTNAPGAQSGAGSFGTGSARLTVNDVGGQVIGKVAYAGTKLADITELKYSTYQNLTTATSFQFNYDLGAPGSPFMGRLVYEPAYDPGAGPVLANSWQEWNVLSTTGHFWASPNGNSTLDEFCPNGNSLPQCTLGALLANPTYQNIRVHANPALGAILFKIGSRGPGSPAFDGNVDKLVLGINSANTTFDFEDEPPTISVNDVTFTESGTADFTVSLTGDLPTRTLPISVTVNTANVDAVAPGDYVAVVNQVVTFAPNVTSMPVSISIATDTIDEPNETFQINLTNAVNAGIADAQGIGTITDDDAVPVVSIANAATVTEGDSGTQTTTFTVSVTNASSQPIVVNVTPGGAANTAGNVTVDTTTVTFPADSATSQTVSATVHGDNLVEGDQNYTATISISSGTATLGTSVGTGTITDDDAYGSLQFGSPTYGVTEGTPTATMSVTRIGGIDGAVSATCSITGGTANGLDYGAIGSVSFADQEVGPKNCTLVINDDIISEVPETVFLLISTPLGGATIGAQNTSILTITDNDGGGFVTIAGNVNNFSPAGPLAGVTLTLTGTGIAPGTTTTTNGSGNYAFPSNIAVSGGSYLVVASGLGKIYDPIQRNYASLFTNVSNANFTAYNNLAAVPRNVRFGLINVVPGSPVSIPVKLESQGNETSVSFSFTYDTAKVTPVSVSLGADASGGVVIPNLLTPGSVGVVVTKSGGFGAAGLKEIATVAFTTATNPPNTSASMPLTFGDTPVARNVRDASANPLQSRFTNGNLIFSNGLEGDVEPGIARDGDVDSGDFIQIGQYAAQLAVPDYLTTNEFQRADVDPVATKGDGVIDLGDFIQAGRFAAVLDPLTSVGGPAFPINVPALFDKQADSKRIDGLSVPRIVQVVNVNTTQGSVVTVSVQVDAEAGDKGISFTMDYDQTRLSSPVVNIGSGANGAIVIPNTTIAGKVGVQLAYIVGGFPAGVGQALTIQFNVSPSAPNGSSPLTFNDTLIQRQVRDSANVLVPANFNTGFVNIFSTPTASNVNVAGHVANLAGVSVNKAIVKLTGTNGEVYLGNSNAFGNVIIPNVPAGVTYVITVSAKGYTFTPRTIAVDDNISKLDLTMDQ